MPLYNNPQVSVRWLDDENKLQELTVITAEYSSQGFVQVTVKPPASYKWEEQSRSIGTWMSIHGVPFDISLPPAKAFIKTYRDKQDEIDRLAKRIWNLESKWFVRLYYWLTGNKPG